MTDSSSLPASARAVVIGAGIVGNSLAYHLARLGWRDLVLIDKGPLPNPGGSTGHASNFIFPVDHSKEMTQLTADSVRQYKEWDVFTESGGIEVARTEERMQELQRRMSSAKAWGIDGCEIITPARVRELVPYIETSVIVGGFYTPGVGIVDSLRFGTIAREKAQELGALHVFANTEVLGIDVEGGRVTGIRTSKGDIATETIVIACGVWAPKIARMAGATIPLTPAVHQMIDVGPVPHFKDTKGVIEFPIVRDMDTNMYERQDGSGLEIGSYAHRADPPRPRGDPVERGGGAVADRAAVHAGGLRAADRGRAPADSRRAERRVGRDQVRDQRPALADAGRAAAPRRDARGEGALVGGRRLGEGRPRRRQVGRRVDDARRVGDRPAVLRHRALLRAPEVAAHVRARAAEGFNKTYGIVHPTEQWESNRNVRLSPFYEREQALGAVFFEAGGVGAPALVRVEREAAGGVRRPHHPPRGGVGVALVVADHQRRAPCDARARAMFDLTAFCIFDVIGPGRARVRADASRCGRWTSGTASRLHAGALAERRRSRAT